jgi:hypothetical protein
MASRGTSTAPSQQRDLDSFVKRISPLFDNVPKKLTKHEQVAADVIMSAHIVIHTRL